LVAVFGELIESHALSEEFEEAVAYFVNDLGYSVDEVADAWCEARGLEYSHDMIAHTVDQMAYGWGHD
jgi:hypothetical protein